MADTRNFHQTEFIKHAPARIMNLKDQEHALDHLAICHECGQVVDMSSLAEGYSARCPRCDLVLSRVHHDAQYRLSIFGISALACLFYSLMFDFIAMDIGGQARQLTLMESVSSLFELHEWGLALFMGIIVIGLPCLFISALLLLVLGIRLRFNGYWLLHLLNLVGFLKFWNMAEIFFLGILISMVKLSALAHLALGTSFWAYALFNLFLVTALANLDRYQLVMLIKQHCLASQS